MSMSRETYGHAYIYPDGTLSEKPIEGKEAVFHYSITENDGYDFMRKGAKAEINISMDNNTDKSKLIAFLQETDMDRTVLEDIKKLHEKGEFTSGSHKIKWKNRWLNI